MKSFTATRIFAVLLAIFLVALFTGYAVAQAPATVTPAPRGDETWADAIEPKVAELMGEKK